MDRPGRAGGAVQREAKERSALIAAYREGLGLAAIIAACDAAGIRVMACAPREDGTASAEAAQARWWCQRASDAERICAVATARLRRRRPGGETPAPPVDASSPCREDPAAMRAAARDAIAGAAKRLNVALYSNEEISAEAMRIIVRVDEEIEALRGSREFKSVNQSYRTYRMEASARGEKVTPYAQWLNKYKANLVRQLANALRYV
jgi:hypothetical protein